MTRRFSVAVAVFAIFPLFAAVSSVITLTKDAVTARTTPGGAAVLYYHGIRPTGGGTMLREGRGTLLGDPDGDGVVRWELPFDPTQAFAIYAVVDEESGKLHAALTNGTVIEPDAAHIDFIRDTSGNFAWAVIPHFNSAVRTLWVRPGVGAWRGQSSVLRVSEGATGVAMMLVEVADSIPVDGSPATPAGVLPGDLFIATIVDHDRKLYGGLVDDRLAAASSVPPQLWPVEVSFTEQSASGTITLLRLGWSDAPASARYETVEGTAMSGVHYQSVSGTVTFAPGEVVKQITVPLINDDVYGPWLWFRLHLSAPSGATLPKPTLHISIAENDLSPAVSIGDATAPEGDSGEREIDVDVTLAGKTRVPATVNFRPVGAGFDSLNPLQVVFEPGETKKQLTLRYTADDVPGPDRVTTLPVSSATDARVVRNGRVVIVDDDSLGITPADMTVIEGTGPAQVAVTLSAAQTTPVSVNYSTFLGTAEASDLTTVSGTLTFTAGETVRHIAVPINQDQIPENEESFSIGISNPTGGAVIRRGGADVTIQDDGDVVSLTVTDAEVNEGEHAVVQITASPPPEKDVRLLVRKVGDTATPGVDFSDFADNFFLVGGVEWIAVRTSEDDIVEPDETFTVEVAEFANPDVVLASGLVTIHDGTSPEPALRIGNASTREGTTASFLVTLSRTADQPVTFRARTVAGEALPGSDYDELSSIFTIPAGQISTTVEVRVLQDAQVEGNESFSVELAQPFNAVIDVASGHGRIIDDDDLEVPVFAVGNVSASEGAGAARFTVTLARAMSTRTSISFGTRDGTAIAGEDYTAMNGTLTFEAGELSKAVDVAIVSDTNVEEDETFTVRLANGVEGTATIVNDDRRMGRSRSVRH